MRTWYKLCLLLFLLGSSGISQAQWDGFHIGMYSFDRDDPTGVTIVSGPPTYGSIPEGTTCEGNDVEYLKELVRRNIDVVLITRQYVVNQVPCSYGFFNGSFQIDPNCPYEPHCTNSPSGLPSLDALDNAHSLGLKVIVNLPEISDYCNYGGTVSRASQVNQALGHFNQHPAIIGYGMGDEEPFARLPEMGIRAGLIRDADQTKGRIRFANLAGMWASENGLTGNGVMARGNYDQYKDYLETYFTEIRSNSTNQANPELMSYTSFYLADRPATTQNGCEPDNFADKSIHFSTMDAMARKSAAEDIPFVLVCHTYTHPWTLQNDPQTGLPACRKWGGNYSGITEESYYNFKMYTSLAYGAKGFFYFGREPGYPKESGTLIDNMWDPQMISATSCTTGSSATASLNSKTVTATTLDFIADLNGRIMAQKDLLGQLRFQNVYHLTIKSTHPDRPNYDDDIGPDAAWSDFPNDPIANRYFDLTNTFQAATNSTTDPLFISFLENGSGNGDDFDAGTQYFWLVNKHLSDAIDFTTHFKGDMQIREVFENEFCARTSQITVHLEPGEGKLFQIRDLLPIHAGANDFTFCNQDWDPATHASDNYFGQKLAENMYFGAGCPNTIREEAEIEFYARDLYLRDELTVEGGAEALFSTTDLAPACGFQKSPPVKPWQSDPADGPGAQVQEKLNEQIRIYPHPNSGQFTLESEIPLENARLEVFNIMGKQIFELKLTNEQTFDLDLGRIPTGSYVMRVSGTGYEFHHRLVIQ